MISFEKNFSRFQLHRQLIGTKSRFESDKTCNHDSLNKCCQNQNRQPEEKRKIFSFAPWTGSCHKPPEVGVEYSSKEGDWPKRKLDTPNVQLSEVCRLLMCFPVFIVFFNPVHQRTDVDFAEYLQILAVRKLLYLLALRYDVQRGILGRVGSHAVGMTVY